MRGYYTIEQVIKKLRDLEKHWPPGIILYGGPQTLSLVATEPTQGDGHRHIEKRIASFSIPGTGGDPEWDDSERIY